MFVATNMNAIEIETLMAEAEHDESRSIDGVVSTFALDESAEKCVLGLSKRTHLTGRGIVRLVPR